MILQEKIPTEGPLPLSLLVEVAEAEGLADLSGRSDRDLLLLKARYLALGRLIDAAIKNALGERGGIVYCDACLAIELRTDEDADNHADWGIGLQYFEIPVHMKCPKAETELMVA